MNLACREKDKSKIKLYGPLAAALSYIISTANTKKSKIMIKTFRGLQLEQKEIEDKYSIGNLVPLTGYTSTTTDKLIALGYAL